MHRFEHLCHRGAMNKQEWKTGALGISACTACPALQTAPSSQEYQHVSTCFALDAALQAGPWSVCSGDTAFGHSSRAVSCVDSAGQVVTAGSETCSSPQPASSAVCWSEVGRTACRPPQPDNILDSSTTLNCNGHGSCGSAGCHCKDGWHGQFCEIAAKCKGVMGRSDRCCDSGLLNVSGECCPAGSVLDSGGSCCVSGQVDVCGKCDGTSWAVDVRVS